jgi:DNA-binding response OmpR family regulator
MSKRILVVEDDPDTLQLLRRLFSMKGCTVFCAASMGDALKVAEAAEIDILVTDITLPDGSGVQMLERFKDRVPVIALTGHDPMLFQEHGFTHLFQKPIRFDQLLEAVGGC